MIEKINYKTLSINGIVLALPKRIREYLIFKNYNLIVVRLGFNKEDPENDETPLRENVHCYDFDGNLKWIYPWGITGMGKIDENTVDLYDGSYSHYVRVSTGDTIRSEFVK